MTSPLATLITSRVSELGLNLCSLAARLGYVNTNKGCRRLHGLMNGDIRGRRELLMGLAAGLEISPETVREAVRATEAQNELARCSAFIPHAIIVTERTIPSQIKFCALTRGEATLRIELDTARPRVTYARQALARLNRRTDGGRRKVPFFGAALGFAVNYTPCRAVHFDIEGCPSAFIPSGSDRRLAMDDWLTREVAGMLVSRANGDLAGSGLRAGKTGSSKSLRLDRGLASPQVWD